MVARSGVDPMAAMGESDPMVGFDPSAGTATDGPAFINEVRMRLDRLEQWVENQIKNPPMYPTTAEEVIDLKIRTAIAISGGGGKGDGYFKPILESKAIQDIGKLTDAKSYRTWSRKMKNAIEQTRPKARKVLEIIESYYRSSDCEGGRIRTQ